MLSRDNKEPLKETLTLYHTTDKKAMDAFKSEAADAYRAIQNTPEKKAEREAEKQKKLEAIAKLEENAYYNKK